MQQHTLIRNSQWTLFWWRAICCAAMLCCVLSVGAAPVPVGWVFAGDGRAPPPKEYVRLTRAQSNLPGPDDSTADSPIPLNPCDQVALAQTGVRLLIKLVNGARIVLNENAPSYEVPCNTSQLSWSKKFLATLQAFVPPDKGSGDPQIAATRGADDLNILGLGTYNPLLIAGHRSVFVAWRNGMAPFKVSLMRGLAGVAPLAAIQVNRRSVDLPAIDLEPGRYVLVVQDANNETVTEDQVRVVKASSRPTRLQTPTEANLDKVELGLLEALSLESQGHGEWRLEALQVLAALPRDDLRVNSWLSRFGVE